MVCFLRKNSQRNLDIFQGYHFNIYRLKKIISYLQTQHDVFRLFTEIEKCFMSINVLLSNMYTILLSINTVDDIADIVGNMTVVGIYTQRWGIIHNFNQFSPLIRQ